MNINRKQLENFIREELQTEKLVGKGNANSLIQNLEDLDRVLGLFDASSLQRFPEVQSELYGLAAEVSDKLKHLASATSPTSDSSQLREAQWGNFTGGAAPLDAPAMDSGPVPKEQLKKLWDIFTEMGKSPEDILAMPEFAEAGIEDPSQLMENRSRKDFLKKIILEELQRECGMEPEPAVVTVAKDHSMGSQEGESVMAKGSLHHAIKSAQEIDAVLGDDVDLPEWLEAKLTKAADYLGIVSDYLTYKDSRGAMPAASMEVPQTVELPTEPPTHGS